ncbi:hypothetical protein [Ruminococcus sp.]|uniref:hypothetical protein n=1 Tax=Ruminococcus sp. TaxID=41978 RepID=UPI0025F78BC1|nr:hypothetical protein [Ruminococcus sp.]MBQ8967314.1 hypothetical protein [Ruminococcus sp.]
MKFKLRPLHIAGIAAFVAGLAVLGFGLADFYRCTHLRDISDMKLADFEEGMFVKGTVRSVVNGYLVDPEPGDYAPRPIEIYTEQSDATDDYAETTYYLLELGEGSGEYMTIAVDEYLSTDIYFQLHSDALTEGSAYDTSHEFVGQITYDAEDEKRITDFAENWQDTYQDLYYINTNSDGLSKETISPYFIKMKEPGARKLWWLFSIPLLFAGSAMFILEGKPSKKKK